MLLKYKHLKSYNQIYFKLFLLKKLYICFMAVKYRLQFNNFDLTDVVVTLESADYTGLVTDIIGVGGESYTKTINGSDSQPYDKHVITTSVSVKVFSDLIDVDDLQMSSDREWKVTVTVNSVTDFVGFLIPDGIQKTLKGAGNVVHLNATCGLSLLDGLKFDWLAVRDVLNGNVIHGGTAADFSSPIQYFRALFIQLNNSLPINWYTSLRCDEYPTRDVVAGALPWARLEVFSLELSTFENIDCMWLLENFCKSLKLWVAQRNGEWYFINLEDLVRLDGVLSVNRILGTTGSKTSTTSTVDFNIDLEGKQINDDAYTYYKNALGKSRVAYNHSQLNNIIPNGSFNYRDAGSAPEEWYFIDDWGTATSVNTLIDRGGYAAKLELQDDLGISEDIFTLRHPLNIDANVLYKDMRFGFVMFPQTGFPVDEDGYINWEQFPFKISVKYTILQGGTVKNYFLNEFGAWGDKNVAPNQEIINIVSVPIPSPTIRVLFNQSKNFFTGDRFNIRYTNPSNNVVQYSVPFVENLSTEDGIDYIVSKIPGSSKVDVSGTFYLYIPYYNGSIFMGAMDKADNYYRFIYPQFLNGKMKPNIDVGKWEFQSKGNSGGIIIPDPGDLYSKDTTAGKLTIEFYVNSGQSYTLDDVWMELNDNQDVYELVTNDDNTLEKFEMGISSSFSGFMMSSYMQNYGNANKTMNFTDYSGTSKRLTELYGRGIMNWRYTPRMIYQGSFKHTSISPFSLIEVDGRKFVPLGYEHNVNTGRITNTKLFEAKLESPTIVVGHNNFNDNSNGANYGTGGGYAGGGSGVDMLVDLEDVNITTPTNNQVLTYNSTTGKWENKSGGSGLPQDLEGVLTVGNETSLPIIFTDSGEGNNINFSNGSTIYQPLIAGKAHIFLESVDGIVIAGKLLIPDLMGTGTRPLAVTPSGEVVIDTAVHGTVTSVGFTAPTGFSVSGSPITNSGTLALSFASGYSLPTTAKQTAWDNKQNALTAGAGITISGNTISATSSSQNIQQVLDTGNQSTTGIYFTSTGNNTGIRFFDGSRIYYVAGSGLVINSPYIYLGNTTTRVTGQLLVDQLVGAGDRAVYADSNGVLKIGSSSSGTVTSVAMSVPTGFSIAGSPITTNGTLALSFASGYSLPTTTKQSEWDGKQNALTAGTGVSIIGNTINALNNGTVTSVGVSMPTGFSVSNSPITSSGNIGVTFASGYSLPSNTQQTTWSNKQDALTAGTGISIVGNVISSTSSSGTVTSVAMSVPTGFSIAGSPITNTGTLALNFASGYSLPLTSKQNQWDNKQNALTAGAGISIVGDVISSTGGGGGVDDIIVLPYPEEYDVYIDSYMANKYAEVYMSMDSNCVIYSGVALKSVIVEQSSTGKLTFTAGAGITVTKKVGTTGRTSGQYSVVEIFYKTATDVILKGDYE